MFLHVSVILPMGGGGFSGHCPPRDQADPPAPAAPGRHPLAGNTTPPTQPGRHPLLGPGNPPATPGRPPWQGTPPAPGKAPPPREEDCSIRSMSGRYASYWNAFLFISDSFIHLQQRYLRNGK